MTPEEEATRKLVAAAKTGDATAATAALAAGAEVNAKYNGHVTPLHIAASYGYTDMVRLLVEAGADIDAGDAMHHTPLDIAAAYGHAGIVKLLKAAKGQSGHAVQVEKQCDPDQNE